MSVVMKRVAIFTLAHIAAKCVDTLMLTASIVFGTLIFICKKEADATLESCHTMVARRLENGLHTAVALVDSLVAAFVLRSIQLIRHRCNCYILYSDPPVREHLERHFTPYVKAGQ